MISISKVRQRLREDTEALNKLMVRKGVKPDDKQDKPPRRSNGRVADGAVPEVQGAN